MLLTKTVEVSGKTLTLTHNLYTYIKYKEFTGRDMLEDTARLSLSINALTNLSVDALTNLSVDALSAAEQEELISSFFSSANSTYIMYLTAALIATAELPLSREFTDILCDIPDDALYDAAYITCLTNFMLINIDRVKKNLLAQN